MPRFMAFHSLPVTEQQFMEQLKQMPPVPTDLSYKLTFCDFDRGKFFCEWEAPNKEAIEAHFKQVNMPYDVVYPVRRFDPSKGELEE